jgi:hypothetical protein
VAIVASLALFIASLAMPALEFTDHAPVRGYFTLLWGWLGMITRDFPWVANPFYFVALVFALAGMRSLGQLFSILAFGMGLLSLNAREWWFNTGSATPIYQLGLAFHFWMASFLVLFVLLFIRSKPKTSEEDDVDAQEV